MINKKILALVTTLMFIVLPITNTSVFAADEPDDETPVAFTVFNPDGKIITTSTSLTQQDIDQINEMLTYLMNSLQTNSGVSLLEIISSLYQKFGGNNLFLQLLLTLEKIRPLEKRVFIISTGYGSKFGLLFKPEISMYKPFTFWHYFGETRYTSLSKTFILDPLPPSFKVFEGWQLGMMRRFIGFYFKIPGDLEKRSHSFFIGYAYKVIAIDLPDTITTPLPQTTI